MKRAPLARSTAPQVMMDTPTLRSLTYGSLPYDTHPIDTYDGPQGWGPFWGPWTPWDFRDPAAEIAFTYGHGESNDWTFAPDYDVITVFTDPAMDWAYNTSYDVEAQRSAEEQDTAYTSTIANVVPNGGSFLARLRTALQSRGSDA